MSSVRLPVDVDVDVRCPYGPFTDVKKSLGGNSLAIHVSDASERN